MGDRGPYNKPPPISSPKAKKPGRMMGTNGDSKGRSNLSSYDYTGSRKGGLWKNGNGTVVGRSTTEDSEITPYKSTGDVGAVSKYISQRKAAGAKGY